MERSVWEANAPVAITEMSLLRRDLLVSSEGQAFWPIVEKERGAQTFPKEPTEQRDTDKSINQDSARA
jgi:hypothetical protein